MKTAYRSPVRHLRVWSLYKKKRPVPLCLLAGMVCVVLYMTLRSVVNVVQFVLFDDLRGHEQPAAAAFVRPDTVLGANTNKKRIDGIMRPRNKLKDGEMVGPQPANYESNQDESPSLEPLSAEEYEKEIQEDEKRIVPGLGDNGEAVELEGEEAERGEADIKREAYNIELSKKVALNRTLPDARHPRCKKIKYPKNLPTASVIIIFTDESLSVLLRTVHSVINRSPPRYLKEIILVDDFSTFDELKGKLDYYIRTRLPKYVKLFRLPSRQGLIRARLKGAREATSEVLVFLDAHCEATVGWIQPILARIKEDRTNVVVPIIDSIEAKTLEYEQEQGNYEFQLGSFTWSGSFTWITIPNEERDRMQDLASPARTPTMAGGLFAMDRKYFFDLGSYDEKMDLWGGENLEISFRIWQCGGTLETVPCSRVGHMFREFHSYSKRNKKDSHGINTARLVKVWWDKYERLFFRNRQDLKGRRSGKFNPERLTNDTRPSVIRPSATDAVPCIEMQGSVLHGNYQSGVDGAIKADIGDLTDRIQLRERLKCRPFSWFLQEVLPSKYIPDENVIAHGWVKVKSGVCLDFPSNENENEARDLGFYPCNTEPSETQSMSLSLDNELRNEFLCAEVARYEDVKSDTVRMVGCDGSANQKWQYTKEGFLLHQSTDLCIDAKRRESDWSPAKVTHCHPARKTQLWTWQHLVVEPVRTKKKVKKPVAAVPAE